MPYNKTQQINTTRAASRNTQTVIKLAHIHIVGSMHVEVEMHIVCHLHIFFPIFEYSLLELPIFLFLVALEFFFTHQSDLEMYESCLVMEQCVQHVKMECEDAHACLDFLCHPSTSLLVQILSLFTLQADGGHTVLTIYVFLMYSMRDLRLSVLDGHIGLVIC